MTGESRPRAVTSGDTLYGGTILLSGPLAAEATARGQLALLGAVLFLLLLVWLQLAFGLLMLFLGTSALPSINDFPQTLLLTQRGLGLLITGSALVTQTVALSAARASIAAVLHNPQPMALSSSPSL